MMTCLTLVGNTHVPASGDAGFHRTLCGFAVAIADTSSDIFAAAPSTATCPRCRHKLELAAAVGAREKKRPASRSLVLSLVRQLNAGRLDDLDGLLAGQLLTSFTSQRVERLRTGMRASRSSSPTSPAACCATAWNTWTLSACWVPRDPAAKPGRQSSCASRTDA